MGVAGTALALMGGDVTFTDLESVLPLLRQNVDANLNPAVVRRALGCNYVARQQDGALGDGWCPLTVVRYRPCHAPPE